MIDRSQLCEPLNPATRHRFHWVKGNDYECWEWHSSGMWSPPFYRGSKSSSQAFKEGWRYVGESHPPEGK